METYTKTVSYFNRVIPQSFRNQNIQISYMAIPDIKIRIEKKYLSFDQAISIALQNTHITKNQLLLKSRKRDLVTARQTIFYLLRKYSKYTLSDIGTQFNQDHATVLHGHKHIIQLLDSDRKFKAEIQFLEDKIIQTLNK